MNTSAKSHGKYIHDTIIGHIKDKAQYGFKNHLIPIQSGDSIAGRTCTYLTTEYAASESSKMPKTFIEVPADVIIYANSPAKRITTDEKKGVKYYHSLYADTNGNIKFRR